MTGTTITGFYSSTVYLGIGGVPSPLDVTSGGFILPGGYGSVGVYASATAGPVSILNDGKIYGSYGGSGFVGTPTYGGAGVNLLSSGQVSNYGTIAGGKGGGGQYEIGMSGGNGVNLTAGGVINNYGVINGGVGGYSGLGYGGYGGDGVDISAAGSLINYGAINGGTGGAGINGDTGAEYGGVGGAGVVLIDGGMIRNVGDIQGGVGGFLESIAGVGVDMRAGGTLITGGQITGGGVAANQGNDGDAGANGVDLRAGGTLFQDLYSNITGGGGSYNGIGTLGGAGGIGVYLKAGGTVTNFGTITGGTGGNCVSARADTAGAGGIGVDLASGGTLTNFASITGGYGGSSYYNYGNGGNGVQLTGGLVTNDGTITGGTGGASYWGGFGGNGVQINGGTLVNDGTITGGQGGFSDYLDFTGFNSGNAVQFGSHVGTLVVDPGAVFNGYVVANAAVADVLQLGGTAPGTLAGLGSEFLNFNKIIVATGANWTLTGPNSVAANAALTVHGALANTGSLSGNVTLAAHGSLSNAGTIAGGVISSGGALNITNSGSITGPTKYGIDLISSATITNTATGVISGVQAGIEITGTARVVITDAGQIAGGAGADAIQFGSGNDLLILDQGASFTGVVDGGGGVNTLELAATAGTGAISALGTNFTNFATVQIDAGGNWTLGGNSNLGATSSIKAAGTLSVTGTLADAGTAIVSTGGELLAGNSGSVQIDAVNLVRGTLSAAATGKLVVGTSLAGASTGAITVQTGSSIKGIGTINGVPITDNGHIVAQAGTLTLSTAVTGTGGVNLSGGATLLADSTLAVKTATFGSGGGTLVLAAPHAVTSEMAGFGTGCVIDIKNIVATTLSFLAGTLTLDNGTMAVDTIAFQGSYQSSNFTLSSDGHSGTDIAFKAAPGQHDQQLHDMAAPILAAIVPGGSGTPDFAWGSWHADPSAEFSHAVWLIDHGLAG